MCIVKLQGKLRPVIYLDMHIFFFCHELYVNLQLIPIEMLKMYIMVQSCYFS